MIKTKYKSEHSSACIDKLYALDKQDIISIPKYLRNRYYDHTHHGGFGFDEITKKREVTEKQLDELMPLIHTEKYDEAQKLINKFVEETPEGHRFK